MRTVARAYGGTPYGALLALKQLVQAEHGRHVNVYGPIEETAAPLSSEYRIEIDQVEADLALRHTEADGWEASVGLDVDLVGHLLYAIFGRCVCADPEDDVVELLRSHRKDD